MIDLFKGKLYAIICGNSIDGYIARQGRKTANDNFVSVLPVSVSVLALPQRKGGQNAYHQRCHKRFFINFFLPVSFFI